MTAQSPLAAGQAPLLSADRTTTPVTVQVRTHLAPGAAFDAVVPIDLRVVVTPWGPIPGVRDVADQSGPWDAVGRTRTPVLSDGSTATERLTELTPPHSFAYEITGFTGRLRSLVAGVRGEWTFTPDGAGTVVRWTYEFAAVPGRLLLLRAGLVPLWHRYMQSAITRTARAAEQAVAARQGRARADVVPA